MFAYGRKQALSSQVSASGNLLIFVIQCTSTVDTTMPRHYYSIGSNFMEATSRASQSSTEYTKLLEIAARECHLASDKLPSTPARVVGSSALSGEDPRTPLH